MADPSDVLGQVASAAQRLQVWAFPLIFAQRVRLNFTLPLTPDAPRPSTSAGAPTNRFGHQRVLSDPELRVGVAPNVDTLYSVAWIDLDDGPFVFSAPDFADRYYSFQVALADTESPWALGQRTHGPQLPPVRLERGPLGYRESGTGIELTTPHRYLMLCGRTLVEPGDPADLARVHSLQDAMWLSASAAGVSASRAAQTAEDRRLAELERNDEIIDPVGFGRALRGVLRDVDPACVPTSVREDLRTCGLASDIDADPDGDAAAPRADPVERGLRAGLEAIEAHVQAMGETRNGWALNRRGPDFADDHMLRAAVALSQIFVNPVAEAMYPVCEVDVGGAPLDGRTGDYTWTLAADDPPPAAAFWSLTLYHRAGLLVENELGRYAIGDRTTGFEHDVDGSTTVRISPTEPTEGSSHWLPAPEGPFRLMLRMYCPLDTGWEPPAVVRAR